MAEVTFGTKNLHGHFSIGVNSRLKVKMFIELKFSNPINWIFETKGKDVY